MEHAKKELKLANLIKVTEIQYDFFKKYERLSPELFLFENYYCSLEQIMELKDFFKDGISISLFEDIKTMNNTHNIPLEHMQYNIKLTLILNKDSDVPISKLEFKNALHFFIEQASHILFLDILKKYLIENSLSTLHKTILINLSRDLKFKYMPYQSDAYELINQFFLKGDLEKVPYEIDAYLDTLIRQCIDALLQFKDEELNDERIYTQATCYQILLRVYFVLLDDYTKLIPYEKYYNETGNQNSFAIKMVRTSFIANYNDTLNYRKGK